MNALSSTVMPSPTQLRLVVQLSLRGPDAWRMYRRGVNPSLVGEMYPAEDHWTATLIRFAEVLQSCMHESVYGTITAVSAHVETHVVTLDNTLVSWFNSRGRHTDARMIANALDLDPDFHDMDMLSLSALYGVLMEVARGNYVPVEDDVPPDYYLLFVQLWLNLCDAALRVADEIAAGVLA